MPRRPTTEVLSVSQARQDFSQLLNRVYRKEVRVIVEKSGIPVAAILSSQDLAAFTRWEQTRGDDFRLLDEIGEAFRDVPDDQLEDEIARAVAEARAAQQSPKESGGKAS